MLGACGHLGMGSDLEGGTLPAGAQRALAAAGVGAPSLAAVALPLGHEGRPWGHRAHQPMQPGSTMKLVTSAVALDRLGPGHRGRTTFSSSAPLAGGVLQGDLRLEGGADPELGLAEFWALLVELRAAGVQRIAGDLVIDRHLFLPARSDLGVPPFDDGPEWGYNVIPDALGLAGALLPVEIDSRSGTVAARTVPPLAGVEVVARMTLAERRCADWEDGWQPPRAAPAPRPDSHGGIPAMGSSSGNDSGRVDAAPDSGLTLELNGTFPRDCVRRLALQVPDRLRLEAAIFRTLWAGLGGALDGRVREAEVPVPSGAVRSVGTEARPASAASGPSATSAASAAPAPAARVLAQRQARPWGEVLRRMNKVSDNPQTRLLYLSLGVPAMPAAPGVPTAALADRVVRQWFDEQGIATPGLVLDNGSGLSRSERITPLALAQLLRVAWAGRHASDFVASLPLAGEDGTMRARLKTGPAAGWARLKTGTLRNVAALAGYVRDARGRPWAVAMMINDDRPGAARSARPALDALVDALARSTQPGAWVDVAPAAASVEATDPRRPWPASAHGMAPPGGAAGAGQGSSRAP